MLTMQIVKILFVFGIMNVEAKKKIILSWKEIISCPDFENKYTDMTSVKIYMANETSIGLKGFLDVKIDLNSPIQMKATVEKDLGNGNSMMMLSYDADLCKKFDRSDKDWNAYINSLVPVPTKCPLAKNKYDVSNVQPQSTDFELKKDMVGNYKSTITFHRIEKSNGLPGIPTMWSCYQLNFNVEIAE